MMLLGILHHQLSSSGTYADTQLHRVSARLTLCFEIPVEARKERTAMAEPPQNFFTKQWLVIAIERAPGRE
jgi:hypothetical protein